VTATYERAGNCALLTIDRPEQRNAIDRATAEALLDGYRLFEADRGARVLVLTGAGDEAFCAGADLKALEGLGARADAPEGPLGFTRLAPSKPAIAAVSGWCVAGGLELALWCDLRVCTDGSRFGCLERRFGVPLIDGGTQRLPRIVGLGRALDLVLTGRLVGPEEALAMGLVTEVVPDGRHVGRALELGELLARWPQEAMLADRRSLLAGLGTDLAEGLRLEAKTGREVLEQARRGARRFAAGEGRGGS
jgi:enoyl-CoA hydratase